MYPDNNRRVLFTLASSLAAAAAAAYDSLGLVVSSASGTNYSSARHSPLSPSQSAPTGLYPLTNSNTPFGLSNSSNSGRFSSLPKIVSVHLIIFHFIQRFNFTRRCFCTDSGCHTSTVYRYDIIRLLVTTSVTSILVLSNKPGNICGCSCTEETSYYFSFGIIPYRPIGL